MSCGILPCQTRQRNPITRTFHTVCLFIAQPTYTAAKNGKKVWEDLPLAAEAASVLAEQLVSHGFELDHQELLKGGEKRTIEDALHNWFEGAEDRSRLILLWAGHGCLEEGQHYLVCRNSPKTGITSYDAINPDLIGEFIAAKCKAEKVLVILDTCHSGSAAKQIMIQGLIVEPLGQGRNRLTRSSYQHTRLKKRKKFFKGRTKSFIRAEFAPR